MLAQRDNDDVKTIGYGDLDNDGDIDVLTISRSNVFINEKLGDEQYSEPIPINTPLSISGNGVTTAHIDNDGLLDVIFYSATEIYWLKNLGDFEFAAKESIFDSDSLLPYGSNQSNASFSIVDFNGDGVSDIVVGFLTWEEMLAPSYNLFLENIKGSVIYLENNGSAIFSSSEIEQFELDDSANAVIKVYLVTHDLDSDGDFDIAVKHSVGGEHTLATIFNEGALVFTTNVQDIHDNNAGINFRLNDIDSDGLVDIMFSKESTWFQQQTDRSFVLKEEILPISFRYFVFIDWNEDGLKDILTLDSSGVGSHVFTNQGDGSFIEEFYFLGVNIYNAAPIPDQGDALIGIGDNRFVFLYQLVEADLEIVPIDLRGVHNIESIAVLDVENDGDYDIISAKNLSPGLSLFESFGSFDYSNEIEIPNAPSFLKKVIARDMNNDGLLDIVYYSLVDVGYMLNNGDQTFTDPVQMSFECPIRAIEVECLYDNPLPELLVATQSALHIYESALTGPPFEFVSVVPIASLTDFDWIALEDVDSDGDVDVILPLSSLSWYENMDGEIVPNEMSNLEISSTDTFVDFNSDGKIDIIDLEINTLQVHSFNETADSFDVIFEQALSDNDDFSKASMVRDLDGDGMLDLLSGGDFHNLAWARGLTNGNFKNPRQSFFGVELGDKTEAFYIDLDSDGDLDIIHGSKYWEDIRLYEHMPDNPQAMFGYTESDGNSCDIDTILFDNSSVTFFDNSTFDWDFGDGNGSSEYYPSHFYEAPGSYEVALTVCNDSGCDTETQTVVVSVVLLINQVANIPTTGIVGQEINFSDQTENIDNWTWVFGDGSVSDEQSPTHVYEEPGTYEVELIVTNSEIVDCTFSFSQTINVEAQTGIENENSPISYYPNPFNDFILIEGLAEGFWTYRLYDIAGRQQLQGEVVSNQVDLRSINSKGLYFLELAELGGTVLRIQVVK